MFKIASYTASSDTTSFTFDNIPQTYTDLHLVMNACCADGSLYIAPNGDTTGNKSRTNHYVTSTQLSTGRAAGNNYWFSDVPNATDDSTVFGVTIIDIMEYAGTQKYKTALERAASATGVVRWVWNWQVTNAITSLVFSAPSSNGLKSGSKIVLYGIKAE